MKYSLMAHDATYYEYAIDENVPLNFDNVCAASLQEDMNSLSPEDIKSHLLGMAVVRAYWTPHQVQHADVVSYAALTGVEEYQDKKMAVVGGVITLPGHRSNGLAVMALQGLMEAASVEPYGYEGFIARCNAMSRVLMTKLNFAVVEEKSSKVTMVKMF